MHMQDNLEFIDMMCGGFGQFTQKIKIDEREKVVYTYYE